MRLSPGEAELEQTDQGGEGVSVSGGMYVKSHSSRLVSGYRTSGVVGSQWLGLGWPARVAVSFFEMSQDFVNHLLLGNEGDDG